MEPSMNWEEFRALVKEFEEETDRAAVILGAAKLDLLLSQLLAKFLLPSPAGTDELLDGDAPLSTFSARINLAYRLALIDAPFARSLHLVRRIRNAFAHEISGSTLNSGPNRDRVKELGLPFKGLAFVEEFEQALFAADRKHTGASAEFRTILGIMIGRLEYVVLYLEPIELDHVFNLIRKDWKEFKTKGQDKNPKNDS